MRLGKLVVVEIERRVAMLFDLPDGGIQLPIAPRQIHTHEEMSVGGGIEAVVELRNIIALQTAKERLHAPLLLRERDRQQDFLIRTDVGALRDVAQLLEVEVGPAFDCHQVAALYRIGAHVSMQSGQRDGPRGLGDGTGVVEDVADGGTDLVVAHRDDLIHELACNFERLFPDRRDRHPVGEDIHLGQRDAAIRLQRSRQGCRALRLHANDPHIRTQAADVGGHAGDQPSSAHGNEDGIKRFAVLP